MTTGYGARDMIVTMIAAGRSRQETADAADISVRTLHRRLQEPAIQAAIAEATLELERAALAQLLELRAAALKRLSELIGSTEPALALRAVKIVLEATTAQRASLRSDRLGLVDLELAQLRDEQQALDQ